MDTTKTAQSTTRTDEHAHNINSITRRLPVHHRLFMGNDALAGFGIGKEHYVYISFTTSPDDGALVVAQVKGFKRWLLGRLSYDSSGVPVVSNATGDTLVSGGDVQMIAQAVGHKHAQSPEPIQPVMLPGQVLPTATPA